MLTDWQQRFAAQNVYEAEGAAAGLQGKKREDCPYGKALNPDGWNFWVYGCETAAGEKELIAKGEIEFCNEAGDFLFKKPVADAIAQGLWKPRWARLP